MREEIIKTEKKAERRKCAGMHDIFILFLDGKIEVLVKLIYVASKGQIV